MFTAQFIVILIFFVISTKCQDTLKLCLPHLGCLQGKEMPGYQGDNFEAFLGVPYAQPPVGNLRFHNPIAIESWEGDLSAVEPKSDCIQKNYLMPHWPIVGAEDCLYLNIYRPKGSAASSIPVIFYIHGGGLFSGSTNPAVMGPEYFMDTKEVILVVVTYRLGPFGFLSSGDAEMPGNFGLKDQLMALKWVHENIAAFGGNPEEITLFGHSSGASSVHFHMINSKTKNLFKRAILSSGNALAPYVGVVKNPLQQLQTIAQEVGIESVESSSTKDLIHKLRSIDADIILNAGNSLKFWFNNILFNYGPVIEDSALDNAFLIEHPFETIRKGNFDMRPWFTGLVSYRGEGAAISLNIYDNQTLRAELNADFDGTMIKLLALENNQILEELLKEYMQDCHVLDEHTFNGFFELFSDYYFYYPVYNTLKHYFDYADLTDYPVYIYKFSYHGPHTYVPFYTGGSTNRYDVVHFDDLIYQFRQSAIFPDFKKDSSDAELIKEFVNILLEFIKTGKPLHYDNIGSCTKEQFLTSGALGMCNYLEFTNSDHGYERIINNEFNMKRMHLWDKIMKY